MNRTILRMALAALLIVVVQATRTLGGTTGALTGYVALQSGEPLADATVTASSPSQTAATHTDARGYFAFVSLIPDTYTVTLSKDGYETVVQRGISVLADNTRTLRLTTRAIKTLGKVTTRAASALVKPGTTADVYSIDASTQEKVGALGGGGSLNQAYSAMAATPGVVVPSGQTGWMQSVHIRGGDFDQNGYEFDGVPVMRSYDDYAMTTVNTLGQQELQIYTGAAPADAQGQGLAGFINQVIKTGTYPGFSHLTLGVGAPALYNSYNMEIGGATPDRNFSYYVASAISTQDFRYTDQFNGASLQSTWGAPFAKLAPPGGCSANGEAVDRNYASCYATGIGPGGYLLGPIIDTVLTASVDDRENVVNLHFGLPHANGAKDDVQLLYDTAYITSPFYSSPSDWGLSDPRFQQAFGFSSLPYFTGPTCGALFGSALPQCGLQYLGPVGTALAPEYQTLTHPVYFAYNPASIGSGVTYIPFNQREGSANPNSLLKLQYQHNIGSTAYLRLYGFSDYSEWPETCPVTLADNFIGYCPFNYYVRTTTNGGSLQYGNQVNDHNLLTVNLTDFTAVDYRANDETMVNQLFGLVGPFAYLVNAANPTAGVCYAQPSTPGPGIPVSCYAGGATALTLQQAYQGVPLSGVQGNITSCGGSACEWFVAENGQYGGANYAKPNFGNLSVQDEIKTGKGLLLDIGLREDRFAYQLSNTGGAARTFWFNAWNNSYCAVPGAHIPYLNANGLGQPCSNDPATGLPGAPATFTNLPNDRTTFWVFQPRLGATWTLNEDDVLRFNAGRYDQSPNTSFEQYNYLQQNLPLQSNIGYNFWLYGFTTTTHVIYPPTSNNYDFSWEHQFADSQVSFKLTPFYRQTHNQIQNFFLNQKTGFVSGLNVGTQTAEGVEFQLDFGNFNQNGLSGLLAYTYTNNFIRFSPLSQGTTILDSINQAIQQYNSFTKACAGATPNNSSTSLCGAYGGTNAVPTFPSGVANPYYNAPSQARLNPNANYIPYSTIPNGIETSANSYEVPHTATLVLNYRRDKWSVSPQMQYFAGSYYGEPLSGYGVNPSTCGALSGATVSGDPRYPYGGTGLPYDALSCTGTIAVPDPYTGVFDNLGAFRQPNQFLLHLQLSYQASPRVTFTAYAANLVNTCFGGSREPWTVGAPHQICGTTSGLAYILPGYAPLAYGANIYNPGATFQPEVKYPYMPNPTTVPPIVTFTMKMSL